MIPMASWNPEYCTVCDKQCLLGSVYCSEQCREADYQKSCDSTVTAPTASLGSNLFSVDSEGTDSSDEDDEVPSLNLSNQQPTIQVQSHTAFDPKASLGNNLRAFASKRREPHFLYASPALKPSKSPGLSPVMSPLIIPQKASNQQPSSSKEQQMSVQSVNTYKRWLAHGAV